MGERAGGFCVSRFRVLVADDEPLAREMVANLLKEDAEIETVLECGDARAARDIIARQQPDIAFLDIEMPEMTGLEIAQTASDRGPIIVFITAFSHYAPQAFGVNAVDYVLKPFSDRRFSEALQRAKRRVRERRLGALATQVATLSAELRLDELDLSRAGDQAQYLQRLTFKNGDRSIILRISEVVWIAAEDYYVLIHARHARHMVRASLASLEERLDPHQFLRVHRAAIVNVNEVREVRDTNGLTVVLSDGSQVPVSRSRKTHVESILAPRFR
jgi:two-component system, LytTR family, response regulator